MTWSAPSNGSITVKHGTSTLSSGDNVPEGATITITTTPDDGYTLSTLKYNDGADHDIKAAKTFTMPAHDVNITTEFGKNSGTTVSVNIADYASAHSWKDATQYTTVSIDSNITATASGGANTGKYYTSGTNWRFYQSGGGGTLTINASNSKKITAITITYTSSNSGIFKYGTDSTVTSGSEIEFDNVSSVAFSVTSSGTSGQCRVTEISVTSE